MRPVTTEARELFLSESSDDGLLTLLTIYHDSLPQPIRITEDAVVTLSRGVEYLPFPFKIVLPSEVEGEMARSQLQLSNVTREFVEILRSIDGELLVDLEVVLMSQPDIVEAGPFEFTLRDVKLTATTITGTLAFEDTLNNGVPYQSFTPFITPGLFDR